MPFQSIFEEDISRDKMKRLIGSLKRLTKYRLKNDGDLPRLVNCGLKYHISEGDFNIYKRLDLLPVAIKSVKIGDLKNAICPDWEEVIKPFFKKENGAIDRSITNSPHLEIIKYYKDCGFKKLKRNFRNFDYYKMLISINNIGYKTDYSNPSRKIPVHYTSKSVWKRISSFIKLFKSIEQNGYLGKKYQGNYISVLEIPFSVSRFGWKVDYEPFELFFGHHRAACLAALSFDAVDVLVLKDIKRLII